MNPQNNPQPPDEESQGRTSLSGSGMAGDFQQYGSGSGAAKDFQPYISGSTARLGADEVGKLQPGDLLGDYEIISLLGVGGMGFVYKARHRVLNKVYALKTLNIEKVNETAWRRLQLEAQAIARMNHPNIIAIHNLGLHDGVLPFYVMDLLEGENLADVLVRSGALSLAEAIPVFIGVASGLGYAHKKGIIHRDIKPGNIFLLKENDASGSRVKLVDFGIAKLSGVDAEVQNLTTAGEIFGSPYYMSPEHCDGKRIDARSDIYSLGCTFFEILTGLPPFRGANSIQTMMMHQSQTPPRLSKVTGGKFFPEAMEEMIATMLEKAPMDRYQNLEEVVVDLRHMQKDLEASSSSSSSSSSRKSAQGALANGDTNQKHPIRLALKICLALSVLLSAVFTFDYWLKLESEKSSSKAKSIKVGAPIAVPGSSSSSSSSSAESAPVISPSAVPESTAGSASGSAPSSTLEAKPVPPLGSSGGSPVIRPIKAYFCGNVDDRGVLKREFDFGAENELGEFEIENQEVRIPATGKRLLPLEGKVTLHCGKAVIGDPSLLDGFRPNDLYGLTFYGHEPLDKSALAHIVRLADLRSLTVAAVSCNFDRESLLQLDLLFELKELELVNTQIRGSELATLSRIKKLKRLTYSPVVEPSSLLAVLAPSKALTELTLERGVLSLNDFKAIAMCPNLRHLRVSETDMTNQCMEAISSLSHLKELQANPSLLDRDCFKSVKKLKNLQELGIGGPKFEASDTVDFSKALGIQVH
jgi:serine/threonine protein kinase